MMHAAGLESLAKAKTASRGHRPTVSALAAALQEGKNRTRLGSAKERDHDSCASQHTGRALVQRVVAVGLPTSGVRERQEQHLVYGERQSRVQQRSERG